MQKELVEILRMGTIEHPFGKHKDPYFMPQTKIYSCYIKDLNVKSKDQRSIERKYERIFV